MSQASGILKRERRRSVRLIVERCSNTEADRRKKIKLRGKGRAGRIAHNTFLSAFADPSGREPAGTQTFGYFGLVLNMFAEITIEAEPDLSPCSRDHLLIDMRTRNTHERGRLMGLIDDARRNENQSAANAECR